LLLLNTELLPQDEVFELRARIFLASRDPPSLPRMVVAR